MRQHTDTPGSMLKDLLKPEILELIEARRWKDLRDVLADCPPEIAELLLHLRKGDRVLLFRALRRDSANGRVRASRARAAG
jgi:hypothetical protein